jgi:hypothetical protein
MMTTFAVTAAGAPTTVGLARLTGVGWEALVPIPAPCKKQESTCCLEAVVRAVRSLDAVDRYFVVAPLEVQERLSHLPVEWVEAGPGGGAENFLRGLRHCQQASRVVATTCDLPMANGPSLAAFLDSCDSELDVNYSVSTQQEMERVFPAYPRTYVTLREGRFTGGGVTVLKPLPFLQRQTEFHESFATRKNSYRMALALGLPMLWGRLSGGAPKVTVEAAFSRWAKLRCGTVPIDPRWALDVDHADDLHYLRWWVRRPL